MLEQEIQRQIMLWLGGERILHWKCSLGGARIAGGRRGKNPMKGFPDVAGVMPCGTGRLFVVEVKTKTGRLSPEQLKWRELLEAKGVFYVLARSLDDVIAALRAYERFAS